MQYKTMKIKTLLSTILISLSMLLVNSQNNVFDVCRKGTLDQIEKIYSEDPDAINRLNPAGYSPLILACYHGNFNVVRFLIDKVDNINGTSEDGTPLMAAVVKQNLSISKILIEKGANPNIADINGTTALHYAVQFKNVKISELLINNGADYTLKDNNGKTPYDHALLSNNQELLNLFKN
ncbi:ankyrin repeat domain-containing protein [Seonamhaeicola marinus]|uniref:Ankyrin repeat domain-containing protein n=2 Tax=Seonamhaeicola marinus TaxID=1912246 RepID=A0A5D0J7S2_9FLAO|nr:ankyrin repeat domain-containing protein [Seonamhaeicola marinus]